MSRTKRKWVAWISLGALLWLQFAVAAYACPTRMDGNSAHASLLAAMPCDGMDQSQPKLCEQHCVQVSHSVDTQPHSTVNAPVLPLMVVAVPSPLQPQASLAYTDAWRIRIVDPPPLVRFGVLRI
jgi:hypothetical protein